MLDFRGDEPSEHLWVQLEGGSTRWLLGGNPHTFRGRMKAWDPVDRRARTFSLDEVTDASDLARAWMAGFLAGNEPEPQDLFGPAMFDADDDDARWDRWRAALAEFRSTGRWRHGRWEHLIPFPTDAVLPAFVWVLRGDEIWCWRDGGWKQADPQPVVESGTLLVDTVCARRGRHASENVTDVHVVCEDCGETTFCQPDGVSAEAFE